MNIAFDARAILGPLGKNRGIGNYTLNQFRTLIQMDPKDNYFFFNCVEPFSLFGKCPRNLTESYFSLGRGCFLGSGSYFSSAYGKLVKEYIAKNRIDVFYITSPFDGLLPVYRKDWFAGIKVVATVYDIIPYLFKKHYLRDSDALKQYMGFVEQLRWADKLLAISKSVKDDLVNALHFDPLKIDCFWGAASPSFRVIDVSQSDWDHMKKAFHIHPGFIMCTGGDDERKNIGGLIEAYARVPKEVRHGHQLVIVCKLSPASVDKYRKLAEKYHVGNELVLTNYVSDEDLLKLYNMAYLVAFPSKYEGFGLPVAEAFACGAPVLTSNNSSLVQIAGDAAYLVDPFSIESISERLAKALTDKDIGRMKQKGFEQVKKFQWKEVAKSTIESIESLNDVKDISHISSKSLNKPKLAFFTPLPPKQSGISDYSVDIINEISAYFDIDVFIDDGYTPDCLLPDTVKVVNHRAFDPSCYKYVIYQYGNSEYHFYMNSYIRKYPGIVVLHDANIHGALAYKALNVDKDFEEYKTGLLEDYAEPDIASYLEAIRNGSRYADVFNIPANGYIVNHATKIIVHSNYAKERLLRKNIGRNVKVIPHYAKINPLPNVKKCKNLIKFSENSILITAFGHVQQTKRVMPALQAFYHLLAKKGNLSLKLVFVGKLASDLEEEFFSYIKQNHLQNDVRVTGFVDLDQFKAYLDASDICLNLRYPYNGETSGSLMRILADGKCVLVNRIGSFDEIPDDACIKLPNVADMTEKEEVEAIAAALEDLVTHPEKISRTGSAARKYAEENLDIHIIGRQYRDFILETHESVVTEDLLSHVRSHLNSSYTDEDIHELAKTLAYLKA